MLDALEYGLDRVTDPNENKVNQVRQGWFSFFNTPTEFVWEDPENVPGVVTVWALQAECVSSALTAEEARG